MKKKMKYTPDDITSEESLSELRDNDIVVFETDLDGNHYFYETASMITDTVGTIEGKGVGIQYNSYAIPTMGVDLSVIEEYVNDFIEFARTHPKLNFIVTHLGTDSEDYDESDLAPFFDQAVEMSNVLLPKSFHEIINVVDSPASKDESVKAYGQTRTYADILVAMNEEKQYKTPKAALKDLFDYIDQLQQNGGNQFSALSMECMANILNSGNIFKDNHLCADELLKAVEQKEFDHQWDKVYFRYCICKLWNIVCYFNEFRRYTSPQQIIDDLNKVIVDEFFFMTDASFDKDGGYPRFYFEISIKELWKSLVSDGVLDNEKVIHTIYKDHEDDIEQNGIKNVIRQSYTQEFCHSEIYTPNSRGTAPIYIEWEPRKFVKSCGNGRRGNARKDFFETRVALRLLDKDENYQLRMTKQGFYKYFVPKDDQTLPIYSMDGKMNFSDESEREEFLDSLLDPQ